MLFNLSKLLSKLVSSLHWFQILFCSPPRKLPPGEPLPPRLLPYLGRPLSVPAPPHSLNSLGDAASPDLGKQDGREGEGLAVRKARPSDREIEEHVNSILLNLDIEWGAWWGEDNCQSKNYSWVSRNILWAEMGESKNIVSWVSWKIIMYGLCRTWSFKRKKHLPRTVRGRPKSKCFSLWKIYIYYSTTIQTTNIIAA